jgi:hypothetical protein
MYQIYWRCIYGHVQNQHTLKYMYHFRSELKLYQPINVMFDHQVLICKVILGGGGGMCLMRQEIQ